MIKTFAFLGLTNWADTVFYLMGRTIEEVVERVKTGSDLEKNVFHHGVAYELECFPRHLLTQPFDYKEVARLIRNGAVPFSYMRIHDRWLRADQSLLSQGVIQGMSPEAVGVYHRNYYHAEVGVLSTITLPEPDPEVMAMAGKFIDALEKHFKPDYMTATRDIVRKFS